MELNAYSLQLYFKQNSSTGVYQLFFKTAIL